MGEGGIHSLEKLIGCTLDEAFALLSGRGVLATILANGQQKCLPARSVERLEGTETP